MTHSLHNYGEDRAALSSAAARARASASRATCAYRRCLDSIEAGFAGTARLSSAESHAMAASRRETLRDAHREAVMLREELDFVSGTDEIEDEDYYLCV